MTHETERTMPKYHLTYSGSSEMPHDESEIAAVMETWQAWFGQLGDALVDGGNPFGPRQSISPDGTVTDAGGSSGYSVITAGDLAEAVASAKGCPVLGAGGAVEVSECIEM